MAGLAKLFDKRKIRRAKAVFAAWWDGRDPPPPEPEPPPAPPPPDPRLVALRMVWGEDQIGPLCFSTDWTPPNLADGPVALLGPGGVAQIRALALAPPANLHVFEWRDHHSALAGEWNVSPYKLAKPHLPIDPPFQAIISCDELTYVEELDAFARALALACAPGGVVWAEAYCASAADDTANGAFASAFADPHVRPPETIKTAFETAGFACESAIELAPHLLAQAKTAFEALAERLSEASPGAMDARGMQELAWEVESWALRRKLLREGRLNRLRFCFRRSADKA